MEDYKEFLKRSGNTLLTCNPFRKKRSPKGKTCYKGDLLKIYDCGTKHIIVVYGFSATGESIITIGETGKRYYVGCLNSFYQNFDINLASPKTLLTHRCPLFRKQAKEILKNNWPERDLRYEGVS